MFDIHQHAWLGALAFVPALFLLAAGWGWRKLAQGLALSLGLPLVGAVVLALTALKLSYDLGEGGGSGEWRGLGELFMAVLVGGATFLILFVSTLLWQLRSKRMAAAVIQPVLRQGETDAFVKMQFAGALHRLGLKDEALKSACFASPSRILPHSSFNSKTACPGLATSLSSRAALWLR